MIKEIEGVTDASGCKVAIVVTRWNELITNNLLQGAKKAFLRCGGKEANLTVVWVSGAFEVPLACKKLAESGKYNGVVALGCVIRGSTPHFEYVAGEASKGIMNTSLTCGIPIGFGLLTTDNLEQAMERSGAKAGNKGAEAMQTTIEMINLCKNIS